MPKEVTHWAVAKEISNRLAETGMFPGIIKCIQGAPNLFLLGAVGPDYLFYYLTGKELESFRSASMILHGRDGGNTLRPVAITVERYGGMLTNGVGAFLLGYICHVVTDSVFHPCTLYVVGKGPGRNQYEHHVFESVLDLYIKETYGEKLSVPFTLRELMDRMEITFGEFLQLLGTVSFLGAPYSETALAVCIRRYKWLQSLFWSSWGCTVSKGLKLLHANYAYFEASFYQKRFFSYAKAFEQKMTYKHPVTGEDTEKTIQGLMNDSVEKMKEYAAILEPLFQTALQENYGRTKEETEGIIEGFRTLEGPNLETGIPGDKADRILYTNPEGLSSLFGPYGYRYQSYL